METNYELRTTNNGSKIGAVMVVGAGVGGIQASLDLAESGFKVYLVEKNPCIGGVMAQLDKTFPTNDCAMCTLAPRLVDAGRHPDIEKITNADVEKIEGEPGNFSVTVKKRARYIDLSKCTGCSLCIEKCPIKLDSEFNMGLVKRTAISRRYPQAVPSAFSIDKVGVAPCRFGCPAEVNCHAYVALIAEGRFAEALAVERRENPFPAICGRICPHPCELECTRKDLDEPVSIAALKAFLADWESAHPETKPPLPDTLKTRKEKIAIIGAGPAGLTCAHYLALKGYNITIFEALPVAGGMLRVGVPAYRLPRDAIQKEIETAVTDLGVEIKLNTPVKDLAGLKSQGYDAILVAVGAHKGLKLDIPGEDSLGVIDAVAFLRDVNLGKQKEMKIPLTQSLSPQGRGEGEGVSSEQLNIAGKSVIVVGGGNTAIDTARSALRLGAKEVVVAYRRSRKEMPASPWEIEEAEEEGVKIKYLVAPVEVIATDGNVNKVKLIKMRLGEPDASGRRRPEPIKGSEFTIPADIIIPAISQQPDLSGLSPGIALSKWGYIKVDGTTLETDVPYIFAAGDAVSGPATAIEAIEAGKIAAESIDRYLRGEDLKAGRQKKEQIRAEKDIGGIKKAKRISAPLLPVRERRNSFKEVVRTLTEEEAIREASRCLDCAICCECLLCVDACEAGAINHEMEKEEVVNINVGSVILSPGFEPFDPTVKTDLGFGVYPNVVTSLQFERLLSPSGPTMGKVLRPSDNKPPKRIAFIQCVGSREEERDWCSAVCCMYATKEALIAKEHERDLKCDIFFMDLRAFSKGYEEYYQRAKKQGVNYIRCRVPSIEEVRETRNLIIKYVSEEDKKLSGEYDLVVLSIGLGPPKSVDELAVSFGLALNEHKFCKTDLFTPVSTSREGIFAAGPFTGPKDIPETVTQASAAAAKAGALLAEARRTLITHKEFPKEIDVTGQDPRVGVFVCHCGKNIGGVINVKEVAEYAKTLSNVVFAKDYLYACSVDSCEDIKKMVKENNLNRVVVASCTPRTHEPLFQSTVREAGLNPYLFEMANIRDQNTWVHMHEPEAALKKAKDLVRIAVAKARLLEPLEKRVLEINHDALVIGGGLAGMTAALELANQGFETHLVEKENDLGGNLRKLHFLLDGERPQERLSGIINAVKTHGNVSLYTGAEITKVEGSFGNFKTTIKTNGQDQEINHGIIVVATGAKEYKPTEYLYGEDPRVMTQLEFEEKLALTSDFCPLSSVVMIQCVGSRVSERNYCSRLCCEQAIKNALKIKEISPKTNVYILYKDVMTYGLREGYYTLARQNGVVFIRYDDSRKPEVVANGGDKLEVRCFDPVSQMEVAIDSDLVVLSPAIIPRDDNKNISQMLKVPLTQDGFFLEAHMKLRPIDFATDGVFLCGLAHFPKTVDESIMQATASASRATTILSKDKVELDAIVSHVIDENCDGCAYCIDPCPYHALTLIEYMKDGAIKKTVDRDLALCKGCGVCQATCPKAGIAVANFKLAQLMEMVHAALES